MDCNNVRASGVGSGTVFFSVLANAGIARAGAINIAGQTFNITQAAGGPVITNVDIAGKKFFVFGREFALDADILINAVVQKKVSNDDASPTTLLVAKKAGKELLAVKPYRIGANPNGTVSPPFTWTRP